MGKLKIWLAHRVPCGIWEYSFLNQFFHICEHLNLQDSGYRRFYRRFFPIFFWSEDGFKSVYLSLVAEQLLRNWFSFSRLFLGQQCSYIPYLVFYKKYFCVLKNSRSYSTKRFFFSQTRNHVSFTLTTRSCAMDFRFQAYFFIYECFLG